MLLDEKMAKMAAMRQELSDRIEKYDQLLLQWSEPAAAPTA
jgi:hypothetical protein